MEPDLERSAHRMLFPFVATIGRQSRRHAQSGHTKGLGVAQHLVWFQRGFLACWTSEKIHA